MQIKDREEAFEERGHRSAGTKLGGDRIQQCLLLRFAEGGHITGERDDEVLSGVLLVRAELRIDELLHPRPGFDRTVPVELHKSA